MDYLSEKQKLDHLQVEFKWMWHSAVLELPSVISDTEDYQAAVKHLCNKPHQCIHLLQHRFASSLVQTDYCSF